MSSDVWFPEVGLPFLVAHSSSLVAGTGGRDEDSGLDEDDAVIRNGRAPVGEAWLVEGIVMKSTLRILR